MPSNIFEQTKKCKSSVFGLETSENNCYVALLLLNFKRLLFSLISMCEIWNYRCFI